MSDEDKIKVDQARKQDEAMAAAMAFRAGADGAKDARQLMAAREAGDKAAVARVMQQFVQHVNASGLVIEKDAILHRVRELGGAAAEQDMRKSMDAEDGGDRDKAVRLGKIAFEEMGAHVLGHDRPLATPGAKDQKAQNVVTGK